jgi:hypothetical protein
MGKLTINGIFSIFSIAMLNYQRVSPIFGNLAMETDPFHSMIYIYID